MKLQATADACPSCGSALLRPEIGQPWCPRCEWNLAVCDPEVVPARGWRWLDRRGHRIDAELAGWYAAAHRRLLGAEGLRAEG